MLFMFCSSSPEPSPTPVPAALPVVPQTPGTAAAHCWHQPLHALVLRAVVQRARAVQWCCMYMCCVQLCSSAACTCAACRCVACICAACCRAAHKVTFAAGHNWQGARGLMSAPESHLEKTNSTLLFPLIACIAFIAAVLHCCGCEQPRGKRAGLNPYEPSFQLMLATKVIHQFTLAGDYGLLRTPMKMGIGHQQALLVMHGQWNIERI